MKAHFHRFESGLLTFLVLFSTLSFSVDMHFCGHTLVDVELFQKAKGCGMDMDEGMEASMGCCRDHQVVVAGQNDLKLPPTFNLSPLLVIALPLQPLSLDFVDFGSERRAIILEKYIPPLLIRDLSIQHQVFLI